MMGLVQHEDGSLWFESTDNLPPVSPLRTEDLLKEMTDNLRHTIYVPSFCEKVEAHIRETLKCYGYQLNDPNKAAELWANIVTQEIAYLMSEDVLGADYFSAQGMVRDTIRKIDVMEYYR